ncbi:MAG: methionine--tRNA ligase [Patescibacteria group bacterium]
MAEQKKDFYITTSIPYVNAAPHIGFALELLEADVVARYHRTRGERVFFLTGTDEHGKKIQEAAEKEGATPQQYADTFSAQFHELGAALGITNDDFIRTSDEQRHIPVVQKVLQQLKSNGDIYKDKYEGRYCTGCEAFLREAEIADDGTCVIHERQPERIYEENYFFRFSKYAREVERMIREDVIRVVPAHRKKEMLNLFSEEGVRDVSISRPSATIPWGIAMPHDDSQTVYVWVDALLNYLSGAGFGTDVFAKRWPADIHIIGKDIARFHTMLWPAMLLALALPPPRAIFIHGHINVEGRKMSKSLGNVVGSDMLLQQFGKDAVRYLLCAEIPSDDDGDFSFARFHERYAADLQNGIGNLVSRVVTVGEKYPDVFGNITLDGAFSEALRTARTTYEEHIGNFQLHHALSAVTRLVKEANKLVDSTKLWELPSSDPAAAVRVMHDLAGVLFVVAELCAPFMPDTAEKIRGALGVGASETAGRYVVFTKPAQPLFPRLAP